LLGVCERSFRRYINRYEDEGLEGLIDKRLNQISHRRVPVDEVVRLVDGNSAGRGIHHGRKILNSTQLANIRDGMRIPSREKAE
jgi:Winged helix-turn helix